MSEHLKVGMWLGTENRIVSLRPIGKRQWVAKDSTGAEYRSTRLPDGLRATDHIEPDVSKRGRVPWPPRSEP